MARYGWHNNLETKCHNTVSEKLSLRYEYRDIIWMLGKVLHIHGIYSRDFVAANKDPLISQIV